MALRKLRMTEKEFDRWVWTIEGRAEFVDGEVILLSPESCTSDSIRTFLKALMLPFLQDRTPGSVLGPEMLTHLRPGLRRMPDVLVVMQPDQSRLTETFVEGGPTVTVEIVSRRSGKRDRIDKVRDYQEAGVAEYWLIDPRIREAIFYRLNSSGQFQPVPIPDGVFRSEAIPGFWLRVDWLFQYPHPRIIPILREYGLL